MVLLQSRSWQQGVVSANNGLSMRVVHNSLHEQVADTLRQEIFSGTLAPGSFVDETALCVRLEISRTPLRAIGRASCRERV